jgi:hypothetical protein
MTRSVIMRYQYAEEFTMPDILIRGLSPETVAVLDERASTQGVSRNAVITEILSREALERPAIDLADLTLVRQLTQDLGNPEVMQGAWR